MNKLLGGRLLGRFSKSSNEEVRLTLHSWGVGESIDVRIWTKVRPTDGAPSQPTELGFSLDVDLLADLNRVVEQAIVALGGDVEDHGDERPQDPEVGVPGRHEGESGDPRPAGEKRRAEIDQVGRTPEGEGRGQPWSWPWARP